MRQSSTHTQRGFTILELLTVIAIIAILMALIFPVASTMRERGNQTACIGNLQNIGQALKLYRLDEREFPPALYGYLVEGDTEPTTFLYPHYLRSRRDFKCPDNPNRLDETAFGGPFQGSTLPEAVPHVKAATNGPGYKVEPMTDKRIAYYLFDSYDGGVLPPHVKVPPGGTLPVNTGAPSLASPSYRLTYRRDWYSLSAGSPNATDPLASRELLNRNPEDSTFVTECTYHRDYRAGGTLATGMNSVDMVLFLDGHVEKIPSDEVETTGWKTEPKFITQP